MIFTGYSLQAENKSVSSAISSFVPTADATFEDITNLSVSITVSGNRLVFVGIIPDTAGAGPHQVELTDPTGGGSEVLARVKLLRGSDTIALYEEAIYLGVRAPQTVRIPVSTFYTFDRPTAGTHTYKAQLYQDSNGSDGTATITYAKLIAIELLF